MEIVKYTAQLDLTDNGCFDTGWRIKQGDFGNSQIVVSVVNNGENAFDENITPSIVFKRPDGKTVIAQMDVADNVYTYIFVGNELQVVGMVVMDVKFESNGRTSTASCKFMCVEDTIGYDPEGSKTYDNPVAELIKEAKYTSYDAEAWAKGTRNGVPVSEDDETYNNNAKWYSQHVDTQEITDARVGVDGTTYNSLSERLAGDNAGLKEDLYALNSSNLSDAKATSSGVYINSSTGRGTVSSGFNATSWVDVENNTVIVLTEHFSVSGTTNVGLAFFDYTTAFISGVAYEKDKPTVAKVPANAKFMRFTVDANKMSNYKVFAIPTQDYYVKTEGYTPYSPKEYKYSYNAIGDSLTYGFIGFNSDGTQKRLSTPYPEKVKELLGFTTVYNNGQTGTTVANDTSKMGTNYPMSNDNRINNYQSAAIVSIMGGVNDVDKDIVLGDINSNDDSTFYGGYKKLIEAMLNKTYLLLFIIIPPFSSLNYEKSLTYANAIKEIAHYYSLPVLDMFAIGKLSWKTKGAYTVDGTHFNQTYVDTVFAQYVANFIKENLVNV